MPQTNVNQGVYVINGQIINSLIIQNEDILLP